MVDSGGKKLDFHKFFDLFHWLFHVSLERLVGFAIVTYFSGWQYLDAYFSRFNAREWNAWFNDYAIFLYSFFVLVDLKNSWVCIVFFVLFLFVFLVVVAFLSMRIPDRYDTVSAFIGGLLVVVGVFWFLYYVSHNAGIRKAEQLLNFGEGQRVEVYLSEEFRLELRKTLDRDTVDILLADLIHQGRTGTLRLVWRTNDDTIVLLAGSNPPTTYRIPNRFVVYVDAQLSRQIQHSMEQPVSAKGEEEK